MRDIDMLQAKIIAESDRPSMAERVTILTAGALWCFVCVAPWLMSAQSATAQTDAHYELTAVAPDGNVYVLDTGLTADDCTTAVRDGVESIVLDSGDRIDAAGAVLFCMAE